MEYNKADFKKYNIYDNDEYNNGYRIDDHNFLELPVME
jgi:hypothetical protein